MPGGRPGTGTGTLTFWDGYSGRPLGRVDTPDGPIQGVEFSPDGARLATSGADGVVRVWDAARREVVAVLRGANRPLKCVAFAGPNRVAASDRESGVWVWELNQPDRPTKLTSEQGRTGIHSIAASPAGGLLAVCGETLQLFDLTQLAKNEVR